MRISWANLCRRCYSTVGSDSSTIFAVATGGIRSAISVIRISGPKCSQVVQDIGRYSGHKQKFPKPRIATLRKLYDPITLGILDHGILLWFPGPHSYTGEDCCEFHIHGGPSVIGGVLKAIGSIDGCRPANPGEFTKRAFLNGKMDLTEVDGLADLLAAETEYQRVQALQQMSGCLSQIYHDWRDRLAKCLANSEAFIDFGEDENIESDVMDNVMKEITLLVKEIATHLQDQKKGQRLRDGVRIAIVGEPNVGKSTLLNKLSGRDCAIVSSIPGTTRDVIESCINIQGYPIVFVDTAGIRHTTFDVIENEGIKRSIREIKASDIVLLVVDASNFQLYEKLHRNIPLKEKLLQDLIPSFKSDPPQDMSIESLAEKTILLANKVDTLEHENNHNSDHIDCRISCKTETGMKHMHQLITKKIIQICGNPVIDPPHITQERYRVELNNCVENLIAFLEFNKSDLALRTNFLKLGITTLGRITGSVSTEQILDIIFRDFCIGK